MDKTGEERIISRLSMVLTVVAIVLLPLLATASTVTLSALSPCTEMPATASSIPFTMQRSRNFDLLHLTIGSFPKRFSRPSPNPVSSLNSRAHYLFGTLETANGSIFGTLGLRAAEIAKKEHAAGVTLANVSLAWKDYEVSDGVFNENQMEYVTNTIKTFLHAGQKVDVQLAIHYAPSWAMQIPNAYYVNQCGVTANQSDGDVSPNYVFNKTIRQKVQDFETHALQQLNARVGLHNIWDFRIDGGDGGEALYPPSTDAAGHSNSYWAYDNNAQGKGNNLPVGISTTPFPGWRPGQRIYNGQPFPPSQVQQWYRWYFGARMNYYNWQIALYRNAGVRHYLTIETPGFGTRPDEYRTNMKNYLDGSGDPNGTMSRAAVWQNLYPELINKTKIIAYVSSLGDHSGIPPNDVCHPNDRYVSFDTDPRVDTWGAVKYISYIADKYDFLKGGENPGYEAGSDYGVRMLHRAVKEMVTCGLMEMFWAHDERLYTTSTAPRANIITLADYAKVIHQYN